VHFVALFFCHILHQWVFMLCLQVGSVDEDDDGAESCASAAPDSSQSQSRSSTSKPPSKKSRNLEDAMMAFLTRPRQEVQKPPEMALDPSDERSTFAAWFASRCRRVPEEK